MDWQAIIQFWFEEIQPAQWWKKDLEFDAELRQRFAAVHAQAARCELWHWRSAPHGRLAEIIILDQFSRNMFRDQPASFAHDAHALTLAQEAVAAQADTPLTPLERSILYMPYMHSESMPVHDVARELFGKNGVQYNCDYEQKHRVIIERFGRYPHRNAILGRESTAEELEFLSQPGSRF
jgi:uncharacterized protein (DUF924 family)